MGDNSDCLYCRQPPLAAIWCEACGASYCQSCYVEKGKICLRCNQANTCAVNHNLRQFVARCEDCGRNYYTTDQTPHNLICPNLKFNCNLCQVQTTYGQIKLHMFQNHYFEILEGYGDPVYRISRLNY